MSLETTLEQLRSAAREAGDATVSPDDAFAAFEEWVWEDRGLRLYPAQEEAILGITLGSNVILATPTGTGKSLVALGAHFSALTEGRRTVYTAPIKALVSEKFFELVAVFGAENVGMITGDASINSDAPVICCTAEILANLAIRDREIGGITQVVMDEFHYYAEPERGWAWQVPLLMMPDAQFLLMSATLGDVRELAKDLSDRTGRDTSLVTGVERPVPLHFNYAVKPAHEVVEELIADRQVPAYLVHFNQSHAVEQAQALSSIRIVDREGRDEIAAALGDFRFSTGFGVTLSRLVRSGIGVHHAGMLPRYRRLVEQLAQRGLLRVICGTDTLGVGINVPIRTVVITALTKFDGVKMRRLSAREFHQISGRAGRAGYDTEGDVIALAPEHDVENAKSAAKAAAKAESAKGGKKAKPAKKKSAPQGFVAWSEATLDKLVISEPEPLVSRMRVSHSMVLGVIGRGEINEGDALETMRTLVFDSHEPRANQFAHARTAIGIFRTLRNGGIVEVYEDPRGHRLLRLTVELQANFALNQPLSPFALAAIELLDPESDTYALDVISIIEATLENPRAILRAQEHAARGEAVAAMKAEGIEYEERMELLEEITYPQPLKELLDEAFHEYLKEVPWARDFELKPKSVVRDMIERAFGFRDVVSFYQLGRAEGGVLRYLSDAFRAISRTVPEQAKSPELEDLIDWLGELVRQIDSSLIDEWEELANPEAHAQNADPDRALSIAPPARSVLANERAFLVMLRNALFRRVQGAAFERYSELAELDGPGGFSEQKWRDALAGYYTEYDEILLDGDARSAALVQIDRSSADEGIWRFRQVLLDPENDRDWRIEGTVDLEKSELEGEPVVRVDRVGPFAGE
ncbi:superfamily II DNA/RNA helicase [Leucobacter exalbidus]|uniref:Superfamily II DNA/RNA helicase n=1 Tax=Leucobacter exalbidus TaxID=662960 RepID=A0A940PNX8_9MICO|nr:superfamily II DNA/RNA helicase [Leucobacter exalbidus]